MKSLLTGTLFVGGDAMKVLMALILLVGSFWSIRVVRVAAQATESPGSYREEELVVSNGPVRLSGTLTLPAGAGPFPVAVMITGSGPHTRDQEVAGFKIFKTMADYLARHGIGTYRFDDRGTGQSTGTFASATTADFASDALAAVDVLRQRPDVRLNHVGLIGHSDGGTAAAIAASRSANVAFVVSLAGPGAPFADILTQQIVDIPRVRGVDRVLIDRIATAHKKSLDAARAGNPTDLAAAVKELVAAQYDAMPPQQRAAMGEREAFVQKSYGIGIAQLNAPWTKFMLNFDPVETLRQVRVPVLALFGSLDMQVSAVLNEPRVRQALTGNAVATVKVYPGANHLFQPARTGSPAEYAALPKVFAPGLLEEITSWIQGHSLR